MKTINNVATLTNVNGVGVIAINFPPVNALSASVRDGIHGAMQAVIADPAIDAVVLRCEGSTRTSWPAMIRASSARSEIRPSARTPAPARATSAASGPSPTTVRLTPRAASRGIISRSVKIPFLRDTSPTNNSRSPEPASGRPAARAAPAAKNTSGTACGTTVAATPISRASEACTAGVTAMVRTLGSRKNARQRRIIAARTTPGQGWRGVCPARQSCQEVW